MTDLIEVLEDNEDKIREVLHYIDSEEFDRAKDQISLLPVEIAFLRDYFLDILNFMTRFTHGKHLEEVDREFTGLDISKTLDEVIPDLFSVVTIAMNKLAARDLEETVKILTDLDESCSHLRRLHANFSKIEYLIETTLNLKAECYFILGEFDQYHVVTDLQILRLKEDDPLIKRSRAYNRRATSFEFQGEFNLAIKFYTMALSALENEDYPNMKSLLHFNLARMFRMKGFIRKAESHGRLSKKLGERVGGTHLKILADLVLGSIEVAKGNYGEANRSFSMALKNVQTDIDRRPLIIAWIITELLEMELLQNNIDGGKYYLDMIHEISARFDSPRLEIRVLYCEAMILKHSTRLAMKMSALSKFKALLNQPVREFQLNLKSMFEICELLLFEFQVTQDEDVLQEIENLLERLHDFGERYRAPQVGIQSYLLQSLLANIKGEPFRAIEILDQAINKAERDSLQYSKSKLVQEREKLMAEVKKWEGMLLENKDLLFEYQKQNIVDYMRRAKEAIRYAPLKEE